MYRSQIPRSGPYLDSDRDFGRIEKVVRRHSNLYTPGKYREIIVRAGEGNQIVVMKDHFRDFQNVQSQLKLVNRKKNCMDEKVPFRDLKWIRTEEYGSYLYKSSHLENMPFLKVNLMKKTKDKITTTPPLLERYTMPRLTAPQGSLSEEKIDNLRSQLEFVRDEHKWFYEKIIREHEKKAQGESEPCSSKKRRKQV